MQQQRLEFYQTDGKFPAFKLNFDDAESEAPNGESLDAINSNRAKNSNRVIKSDGDAKNSHGVINSNRDASSNENSDEENFVEDLDRRQMDSCERYPTSSSGVRVGMYNNELYFGVCLTLIRSLDLLTLFSFHFISSTFTFFF